MKGPETNRQVHLDLLRSAAAVAVVVFHVSASVLGPELSAADWWAANFYHASSSWGVPMFIMISGALLLDPARGGATAEFLKRRAARVLLPLVFWTVVFLFLRVRAGAYPWSEAFDQVLIGRPAGHMWYLYMIVGLYLITPPLRIFVVAARPADLRYTLYLALGLGVAYHIFSIYFSLPIPLIFIGFTLYIGYYLAGHVLAPVRPGRRASWLLAGLGVAALAASTLGVGWIPRVWPNVGGIMQYLHLPLSPTVIVLSTAIFLLGSRLSAEDVKPPRRLVKAGVFIAPYSLGVYIVHSSLRPLVANRLGLEAFSGSAWVGVPLVTIVTFAVSLAGCYLVGLVPYLRMVIGLPARAKPIEGRGPKVENARWEDHR